MLNHASKSDLLLELKAAGATIKADGREIVCPFHEDQNPSGGVYEKDGVWRYKCHAASCGFCGDVFDVVANAQGKSVEDVLKEHGDHATKRPAATKEPDPPKVYADLATIKAMLKPGSMEAEYTYTNPETRAADLVVIRYRDSNGKKHFWQVSPIADGWILKRPEGKMPLYNRIQVAEAKVVCVVEGEKCVHALRHCGHVGTTSPMGAGKAAYADWSPLAGKTVILWPDNDEGGIKHMQDVAGILDKLEPPTGVYWVDPKGLNLAAKGDVADFVKGKDLAQAHQAVNAVLDVATPLGAAAELAEMLEATISGRRSAVPWPWEQVGMQTRALLPGTVTLFCGAPGASKSFALLQCVRHWHEMGVRTAIFELEEDRAYHLNRLLAQECENAELLNDEWVRSHAEEVRAAYQAHNALLNAIGRAIYDAPREQVDYASLVQWTQARAMEGSRVIVIDPVTAVSPVRDVWVADSGFIFAMKGIAREYQCSVVLVTHPRKGKGGGMYSMDDMAGGAAFQRFSQTILWLESYKPPKRVKVRSGCGTFEVAVNRILHVFKARNGPGHGSSVGVIWHGESLKLAEQGLLVQETKGRKRKEEPIPDEEFSPREPGMEG